MVGQLGKIGGNVNQIAKRLNSQSAPPPVDFIRDMTQAREALMAIRDDVQNALGVSVSMEDGQ
ncbi:MAG: MobC family plasmid mobilization relaxosome protein [Candidatus Thiodiazotropha lotti]|nr:MobC family plasmid mobilization relaxosome protein [Candidatus Thiodiazotropha lotti]MCW4182241.1 MobC family plasmid mobilization relaxosome protein [Candidatus Thiodiazotropha weberae]